MIYSRDMQNYDVTEVVKSKNRTIYNHGKLRLSCFVSHCARPFCGVGAERIKGTCKCKKHWWMIVYVFQKYPENFAFWLIIILK